MAKLVCKALPKCGVDFFSGFFIMLTLFLSIGCSSITENVAKDSTKEDEQLYYTIGGQAGIERLVNAFVKRIAQDQVILPYFAKSSVKHFKQGFINHLCATVNGPCKYTGDTMIDIHTGMNINEGDFNHVVELLILAMEDVGISYQSQNKILAKLAPLRAKIIKI